MADSRRQFIGKLLGLAVAVAGADAGFMALLSEPRLAHAEGGQGSSGAGVLSFSGEPSWAGWENGVFYTDDGWNHWMKTIENSPGLPIYHDNFGNIPKSNPPHQWAMVIDTRKCIGCQACVVACKSENNVPLGVFRTWVKVGEKGDMRADDSGSLKEGGKTYASTATRVTMPALCNHCEHPPCVIVCPVKATFKRQDGIVMVDYPLCIGCGNCINACPYGARFFNPIQQTADKCTFCAHRVDRGLLPACVTSCVGRARVFGDLLDPESEVSKLLAAHPTSRLKPDMGTEPNVFYIDLDEDLAYSTDPEEVHHIYPYTTSLNSTVATQLYGGEPLRPRNPRGGV